MKFHVARPDDLAKRILESGGQVLSPRVFETNLRFDTPEGHLRQGHRALRLRRDTIVTLTYKGPSDFEDGILSRAEHEVQVQDLDGARAVLEGLGYAVVFEYEKYRTVFRSGRVEIMLDELPYGDFVELEGAADLLRPVAQRLNLRWEAAISDSYHALFEQLRSARGLQFRDLTFRNFFGIGTRIGDLPIPAADT